MPVPPWVIEYTVVLLLGLIAGLLLRFILVVAAVVVTAVIFVWLLGFIDTSALSQLPSLTGRLLYGLPIGPQVLFTLGALVFLVGMFIGLLLTTRIRVVSEAPST
jgi:hypothetical protein